MFNDLGKNCFISTHFYFYRKDLFEDLIHQDFPIWIFYNWKKDRLLNKKALKKLTTTIHNIKMIKREGSSHNIPLEAQFDFASNVKKVDEFWL